MAEIDRRLELPVCAIAYEFIFPGSLFANTKPGSLLELGAFFLNAVMDFEYANKVIFLGDTDSSFIHRIPFVNPSRLTIDYYLSQTIATAPALRPSFLKSNLQDGELLGGTVEILTAHIPLRSRSHQIWVTGVMDERGNPKALLAYKLQKRKEIFNLATSHA